MKFFIALLLIASTQCFLLRPNLKESFSFEPCSDDDGQYITVNNVDVVDGVKGKTAHVNINGTALTDFQSSQVDIVVAKTEGTTPLPIPVTHVDWVNTKSAGDDFDFTYSTYLPTIIPAGDYSMSINFLDENKDKFDCVVFHLIF